MVEVSVPAVASADSGGTDGPDPPTAALHDVCVRAPTPPPPHSAGQPPPHTHTPAQPSLNCPIWQRAGPLRVVHD